MEYKRMFLDDTFRRMMRESFAADDVLREDEEYNESLERSLKEALLSFCVFDGAGILADRVE